MRAREESFSVLIPDGESDFALFVAHCLAPFPNVKLHVLARERWAPICFSRYRRSYTFRQVGPNDEARLNTIAEVVKKNKVDVLLPTGTEAIAFAVANQKALSTFVTVAPVPDSKSLETANNKWLLARFMEENQIPGPPTILVTCDDLFERKLQEMEFPVLLKPVSGWGGEGIERFESPLDLRRYLQRQNPEKMVGRFIVQSFLTGYMLDVNVLSRDGEILATTMQKGIIPGKQKYAAAGAIRFVKDDGFCATPHKLMSALRWSGIAHVDTLCDSRDNQPKILEINVRFWGSLRGSLVAGVSFPYLACLAALDIPFPVPDYRLACYVHSKTALSEGLARLWGKSREQEFSFAESGLKFLLADPLAETIRALRQEAEQRAGDGRA